MQLGNENIHYNFKTKFLEELKRTLGITSITDTNVNGIVILKLKLNFKFK